MIKQFTMQHSTRIELALRLEISIHFETATDREREYEQRASARAHRQSLLAAINLILLLFNLCVLRETF